MTSAQADEFAKIYFAPYLNAAKFCPSANNSVKGCLPDVVYKDFGGSDYQNLSAWWNTPEFLLADGSVVAFQIRETYLGEEREGILSFVDVNGHKKPNTFGVDMFRFDFYPQTGEFLPYGINIVGEYDEQTKSFKKRTAEEINSSCPASNARCAARIIQEGFKINYL